MGKFRQSSYNESVYEFEHNGFILHQRTMKILDDLGIDMDVLCNILQGDDIEARKYALETIRPTRTLYNYLKGKIEATEFGIYKVWAVQTVISKNPKYPKYIKAIEALREYGKYNNELKCQIIQTILG